MSTTTIVAQTVLVPGRLSAQVLLHEISSNAGPVHCWVYLSEGLRALGQREIAFALRRMPEEAPQAFPPDMLHFFTTVLRLAEQGRLVDTGGFTEFGPPGFLGDPNFRGIGYLRMHPLFGLPAPPDALAAIGLMGHEAEVVKRHGLTRVMAFLGRVARQYPCPAWSERGRPCLVPPNMTDQSLLAGVASIFVPGTTAVVASNWISLRLPLRSLAEVRAQITQLPPETALALLAEPDVDANACLVWQPGQRSPEAISPPGSDGSRASGGFMLFVPQQTADAGQLMEDGFAFLLRDASWQATRNALCSGSPLQIQPMGQGMGLAIAWDANAGAPPVQGLPATGELYLRIHTSMDEIAERLPPGALSPYTEAVERAMQAPFAQLPRGIGQDLRLDLTLLPPGRAEVRLSSQPGLDMSTLQRVYEALMAIPVPPVTGGPVVCRGAMAIWGGTGTPLDPG
jgi:hypothetical protein